MPPPMTIAELYSILERLHPDSLLLVRSKSGLDAELLEELMRKVCFSFDPEQRLTNLEYLLLTMHEARQVDPRRYIREVFLPFVGTQRLLKDQILRIIDDMMGADQFVEGSRDDAAYQATKIYRPLVADVLDPYLTLLVASYQFIDGKFVSMVDTDHGLSDRDKVQYVQARIRERSGPTAFLAGYDATVRNAITHTGARGVTYEDKSVLFRSIRRGSPPKVETVRWTNEELHLRTISLIELMMAIDAACEVFGIDSADILVERSMTNELLTNAMGREERLAFIRTTDAKLERLRSADHLSLDERREQLWKVLRSQYAERDMPCSGVGISDQEQAALVIVPTETTPCEDEQFNQQAMLLARYLVLARAVFGRLFERYLAEARVADQTVMTIEIPTATIDEYRAEQAGLVDLLSDAMISFPGGTMTISLNEAMIAAGEDASLEPALPRRGRILPE